MSKLKNKIIVVAKKQNLPTNHAPLEKVDQELMSEILIIMRLDGLCTSPTLETTLEPADLYACCKLLELKSIPVKSRIKHQMIRCGKCTGCKRSNCGSCKECLDKKQYGGAGGRKRSCIHKRCNKMK